MSIVINLGFSEESGEFIRRSQSNNFSEGKGLYQRVVLQNVSIGMVHACSKIAANFSSCM